MPHSLVAPGKQGPADYYYIGTTCMHVYECLTGLCFNVLLFLYFENLTPEWQIEALSSSRGSTTSDNLHLVLVLNAT
jgi:hypothetical protein